MAIPYVRKAYVPSSRMADLVLASGQQQATAERDRGERSAQLWAGLGNTAARTMASVIEAQSEAPRRELQRVQTENAKLQGDALRREVKADTTARAILPFALTKREDGVSKYDRDLLTKEFTSAGIADKLPDIFKGLDAADKAALDLTNAKREGLAGLAYGALVAGATPQAVKLALDHAITNRLLTKDEAVPYLQALEQDPEKAKEIITSVAALSPTFAEKLKPKEAKTREVKVRNEDGTETIQIVEDAPGQTFTSHAEPPKAGTLEDYLVSLAKDRKKPLATWSAKEKADAKQGWEKLNDDPLLAEMRAMRIEQLKRQANVPDMSPAQFNIANRLADDFARDSKDFVQRAQSYGTVLSASKDPSPAGDISLIFAYMKMLDPGSVVREGEFATAQNAGSIPENIRASYNKAVSGERLTDKIRTDFVTQAKNIYGGAKRRQDQVVKTYGERAKTAQVPESLVVMDFGAGIEPETAAPSVPQSAPAAGGGTVKMKAPNGQVKDVPAAEVEHYKQMGATVVKG